MNRCQLVWLLGSLGLWGISLGIVDRANAQVRPDATLGVESSRVREIPVTGRDGRTRNSDVIEGGAQRGSNLFHSFEQFDVPEGRGAYFGNPVDVQNIFSRVTGSDASEINGTLGVLGNANLFFMNPNGILFGPNSSLDLGGSFMGTTANAIGFGELGFFSATNPEVPSQLLTVNPSAFLFNQLLASTPTIRNQANTNLGLRVRDGQNLLLLGGAVSNDGGYLSAFGGRIVLGAVAGNGIVRLNPDGSLAFAPDLARGDISLTNGTNVDVSDNTSGSITIVGRNIDISQQSSLIAGIYDNSGTMGSKAGDIVLDASNTIHVSQSSSIENDVGSNSIGDAGNIQISTHRLLIEDGSQVGTNAYGKGDAGSVNINASDSIVLDGTVNGFGSGVRSNILRPQGSTGSAGLIQIDTSNLALSNGAQIAGSTSGQGDASNIVIKADRVSVDNNGGILSNVERNGVGAGGSINIDANSIVLSDRSQIAASTRGQGNSGDITISANNILLESEGTGININVERDAIGRGGNIAISANSLTLNDRSQLAASTLAKGDAGDITVTVSNLSMTNRAAIVARVEAEGEGQAGNISIDTDVLSLGSGSELIANTRGQGNAGNIDIHADEVILDDGVVRGSVEAEATGRGGIIRIIARSLSFKNDSQLQVDTLGQGESGNVVIDIDGPISLERSRIFANIEGKSDSPGGSISIEGQSLSLLDGSQLLTTVSGQGRAGNITLDIDGAIIIDGTLLEDRTTQTTGISSEISPDGVGEAGDIIINASSFSLSNGGQLTAVTRGRGDSGNISVNARSFTMSENAEVSTSIIEGQGDAGHIVISVDGDILLNGSTLFSNVEGGQGNGGTIQIQGSSFTLMNGSQVVANTSDEGDAGRVRISANNSVTMDGINQFGLSSGVFTTAEETATGGGNSIQIDSPILRLSNGAVINARTANNQPGGDIIFNGNTIEVTSGGQLITSTLGEGQAGTITLNARDSITFSGRDLTFGNRLTTFGREVTANEGNGESGLFANTRPNSAGNGGTITISTDQLNLFDGAQIAAFTNGTGTPGNILIYNVENIHLDNSSISTEINRDPNLAHPNPAQGNIDIQARSLSLANNAEITASTSGQGNAGNITVRDAEGINLDRNSTISTTVNQGAIGNGGNITLNANRLNLDRSNITSSTFGQGDTGSININASDRVSLHNQSQITSIVEAGARGNSQEVRLQTPYLEAINSKISAATSGTGNAGAVIVENAETVSLDNSTISSAIDSGATSTQPGNIDIQTQNLNLTNNAQLTASTSEQGDAGSIAVRDAERINLNRSTISTTVNQGAIGNGGSLTLDTERLNLDRSNITSSTSGQGNTGSIDIQATDRIALQNNSNISSTINRGATGDSQRITLNTPNLSLNGESQISAATNGNGRAGDVQIEADRVALSNSRISTEVRRDAIVPSDSNREAAFNARPRSNPNPQSNITINTRSLNLNNNAQITASTRGQGSAGNITVDADMIQIQNGSRLTTSTSSDRSAGNIRLRNIDSLTLDGDDSGIFANTRSNGRGGIIAIETNDLNLLNNAVISSASRETGRAGNIRIEANRNLDSRNGNITTSATQSAGGSIAITGGDINLSDASRIGTDVGRGSEDGGNITINAEQMRLQENSDIQTKVSSGTGAGGDITINADSVLAFDDSDIISSAPNQGGDIILNTPVFFGSGYQSEASGNPDGNGRVDLDATGTVSSGNVQTPNTDSIQNSLSDLSETAIDADQLLANSCIARNESGGTFLITGAGGLPDSPENSTTSNYSTGEVRSIPVEATSQDDQSWQPGDAMIEPQGVYRLPDGRLVMSRECEPSV